MTDEGGLVFVKLGGSVITDKGQAQTARPEVIDRLGAEIARALSVRPGLRLLLGHGSGSFGHMVARRYGTRQGVYDQSGWRGFAQVAAAAARLNRIVTDSMLAAGLPVWSLQPSASARCRSGELMALEVVPIHAALSRGLVPLVYGDVALDETLGGTIVSTEQIFAYLARRMQPSRLILVGMVDGVFEADPLLLPSARRMERITPGNWQQARAVLGGSHATDVTGGMAAKVERLVGLVRELPSLKAHVLSGERPGALQSVLEGHLERANGTLIEAE